MSTFPTRKIGDDTVSAIGFGAMGISAFYGTVNQDESNDPSRFAVLDAAYNAGCTFWDTADMYGQGDSERLIGRWFAKNPDKRKNVFLATKFGFTAEGFDGSPEHAREAVEASIKRLGPQAGVIDLYYLHRPDPKVPIEESVGAMADFVKQGKVKHLGLSEVSADTLRRAQKVHPIAAVQVEYSPFTLDIEDPKIDVLKTARELGIKIVAYSPLGRGLLTGAYKSPDDFEEGDFRLSVPRFSRENFPNILALVDDLKAIGKNHDATAGQVTLAWLLAQGDDVIPIPGTKSVKYLEENIAAAKVKLSAAEVQEVREKADAMDKAGRGQRYGESFQKQLFAETPALKA